MDGFDRAVAIILDREGVLANDEWDDGGLTKYGISQRANPDIDVKNLDRPGAIALYRKTESSAARHSRQRVDTSPMSCSRLT